MGEFYLQSSKQNMEKYFFGGFLFVNFYQKLLKVNTMATKNFLKNLSFGPDFEL